MKMSINETRIIIDTTRRILIGEKISDAMLFEVRGYTSYSRLIMTDFQVKYQIKDLKWCSLNICKG